MDAYVLVLLCVNLLLACAGAFGAWRRTAASPSEEGLRARIEELDRRLGDELGRLRDAVAASSAQGAAAQKELALQLAGQLERSSMGQLTAMNGAQATQRREVAEAIGGLGKVVDDLRTSLGKRHDELMASQAQALAASQEAQLGKLAHVETTFREFLAGSERSFAMLKEALLKESQASAERSGAEGAALRKDLGEAAQGIRAALTTDLERLRVENETKLASVEASLRDFLVGSERAFGALKEALLKDSQADSERAAASATALRKDLSDAVGGIRASLAAELERVRADNEAKLEKIRGAVEEKLQTTLEARLGESFRIVSERLEQVQRGLGEMATLANGVGDLKRVLTNVRSRGSLGEVQLGALLEQVLAPDQYDVNVATVPNSSNRVEFAIRLPGQDTGAAPVHLPIDAKFPQEDYLRLMDAYDAADASKVEEARRSLRLRILTEARSVAAKYLAPPHTTDFAIMFFPTEGLYAEALRLPGLVEEVQRQRVTLSGPTTLYAVLNSLRLGFQTLAINRHSSEVWRVLGAVKTEFGKFAESLDAVEKKLQEASNKVDEAKRRSRAMGRKMREVEELPAPEASALLPDSAGDDG
jgi:DNA recombination protein RmuC